jgi:hypothetical protein
VTSCREDDLEGPGGHLAGPCDFLEDGLNMTSSDEAGDDLEVPGDILLGSATF